MLLAVNSFKWLISNVELVNGTTSTKLHGVRVPAKFVDLLFADTIANRFFRAPKT